MLPRQLLDAAFDSSVGSQEVNRYLCWFTWGVSSSLRPSTGSLSWLEGTPQARYRIRHRRRRRMATNVLQAMATMAAVDRPVILSSDSMMKAGLQSLVLIFSSPLWNKWDSIYPMSWFNTYLQKPGSIWFWLLLSTDELSSVYSHHVAKCMVLWGEESRYVLGM